MKVFIFCGPAAFGKGGMEKVAINLASYWSKKGNIVHLGYFIREEQTSPAYQVDELVIHAPWDRKTNDFNAYRKRILECKPDVFLLFGASSQIIQIVSLIYGSNIPLVIHEGSNPSRIINENWALMRKIPRCVAAWEREVVLSAANCIRFTMKEYLSSVGRGLRVKARAFPNAFSSNNCVVKKHDNKRIINIGGLKPNKNIFPLLKAFANLSREFPDWELSIFSAENKTKEGSEHVNKVQHFINDHELQGRIILHGEVDEIDVEYKLADIHVITSLSEGLSSSVAEAMCSGIPSIGIQGVPGVDGLIRHNENGLLVDRADLTKNLTISLRTFMDSEKKRVRLGKQALFDAKQFDPALVYGLWDEVIGEALSSKNQGKHPDEIFMHYRRSASELFTKDMKKHGLENSNLSDLNKVDNLVDFVSGNLLLLKKEIIFDQDVANYVT